MNKKFKFFNSVFTVISILLSAVLLVSCNPNEPRGGKEGEEDDDYSEYATKVFDYVYAPGQHAKNTKASDGEKFIGEPYYDIYLGGFGGYIVVGFNHDVANIENEFDFEIFSSGASPEPAVVYVMCDENGDGNPNEIWYELKGSEFENKGTVRDYRLTYYKAVDENSNITWKDNYGEEGELLSAYSSSTTSGWWWSETMADSITLEGTRLPDAYVDNGTGGTQNWVVPKDIFAWGYAENNNGSDYSKESKSNKFDISNAVDANGSPVHLDHIRFIKIQTGVFQRAGWLNEVSSEVQGARDLHY